MNAAQARKKATEISNQNINDGYVAIKAIIQQAVEKGELSCSVYNKPIRKEVRKKLEDEGYKVGNTQTALNETFTQINW